MRIALIEDDHAQAEVIKTYLEASGHVCYYFANAKSFMRDIAHESYDLAILDWILPDIHGDKVLKWLREELGWYLPVIFVTVKDTEEDIVYGLSCGADDYMIKPIKHAELLARIQSVCRRTSANPDEVSRNFEEDEFSFDMNSKMLKKNGEEIEMTHKEFDLTCFMFRNLGRIMSRGHILETVWSMNSDLNTRTVDTHISRIRNKLGLTKDLGWKLGAIYQHGYRLEKWDRS